jgi:cytochrome c biogenesis protein CcmG/thiol:disulfide interchange protein DsbE
MGRRLNILVMLLVLAGAAADFSGCKSGGDVKIGAKGGGGGETKSLPNAPDVTFKDLQGNDVKLASLKGKVVVVNFWATWCEPCQTEIPWLIAFQQKYADKGFTLLGVAMDEEGKSVVDPYVQKTQFTVDGHSMLMNYPIVLGDDDLASKFGGLLGLPTSLVISRDGKIAKRYIGIVSEADLDKEIQGLL